MKFIISHFYLLSSICLAVLSQLIIKWKMSKFSYNDYETWQDKFDLAISMLLNPYIVIALTLTFFAGINWMIAMTKHELSYAYPFTIFSLVLVTIFSVVFFDESLDSYKLMGIVLIILGIIVISKGM